MAEQDAFRSALSNFMNDFASGDAIRHLADRGLTVSEIMNRLSFPTKKELVAETVWKHYLDTGVICTEMPDGRARRKVTYIQEQGEFGRTTLRQVTEEVPAPKGEYVECDFGHEMYRDREAFLHKMDRLLPEDRDYILDLPWPLQRVWHILNERMSRIAETMGIRG